MGKVTSSGQAHLRHKTRTPISHPIHGRNIGAASSVILKSSDTGMKDKSASTQAAVASAAQQSSSPSSSSSASFVSARRAEFGEKLSNFLQDHLPASISSRLPTWLGGAEPKTVFTSAQMSEVQAAKADVARQQQASRDFVWNNANTESRQTLAHLATQSAEIFSMPEDMAAWVTRKAHHLIRPHDAPLQQTNVTRKYLVAPIWESISARPYAAYENMQGEDVSRSRGATYALVVPSLFAGGLNLAARAPSLISAAKVAIAEEGLLPALSARAARVGVATLRFARAKVGEAAEDIGLTFREGIGGIKTAGRRLFTSPPTKAENWLFSKLGVSTRIEDRFFDRLGIGNVLRNWRRPPLARIGDGFGDPNALISAGKKEGVLEKLLQPKALSIFKSGGLSESFVGRLYTLGNRLINNALFGFDVNPEIKVPFTLKLRALGLRIREKIFGANDFTQVRQDRLVQDLGLNIFKDKNHPLRELFEVSKELVEDLKSEVHAARTHNFTDDPHLNREIIQHINGRIEVIEAIDKALKIYNPDIATDVAISMEADCSQLRGAHHNLEQALQRGDFERANQISRTIADLFEQKLDSYYLGLIDKIF